MTDKQIIIDGVDVSGCELYRSDNGVFAPDGTAERTELCYLTNDYCANSPNCYYKQLKRKEQECEKLKNIIDEAQNSKLDLKSFLVGEAIQNEYEQQLDQLKEQLEAYKMEAEEGKEINAELKAELEQEKNWHKNSDEISKANSEYTAKLKAENEELKEELEELKEENEYNETNAIEFKQTLTEIKEIGKKSMREGKMLSGGWLYQFIEQKISEVENG